MVTASAIAAAFAGRRALVTGGAGFVGSHLCQRLVQLGADVVAVDNLSTGDTGNLAWSRPGDRFSFRRHDVLQPLTLDGTLDFVLHLASPASPRDYTRLPWETLRAGAAGTQHALDLAAEKEARFLLASSSEVYGDPLVHPQPETYWGNANPVGPRSVYDEAKRYAEALVACYQRLGRADAAIARIFNTYGPRMRLDDGRAVPTFAGQAQAGQPITVAGDGSQTRSLCFVDDTVAGLLALAASDQAGPVNIGNPHETSVLRVAETVRDLAGSVSPIVFVARPVDDPSRRCPDITLARRALGWEPRVHLLDGLRRTLEWTLAARCPAPVGPGRTRGST